MKRNLKLFFGMTLFASIFASAAHGQSPTSAVTGQMAYQNYIITKYFQNDATIALIDYSRYRRGVPTAFAPKSGQILGRLTTPIAPSPFQYTVPLPIQPSGQFVDLDPNGKADPGVQLFASTFCPNMFGDSYLEQVEQISGFSSVLIDPTTNGIRRGTLLVYAGSKGQKAPSGRGKDGILFTADDPLTQVATGYSLMTISEDGAVRYRRDAFQMDILEPANAETPDFSKQGILASFESLMKHLRERYAYTQLRGLNWDEQRERYLDRVKESDQKNDLAAYCMALHDLATGLRDAHVQLIAPFNLKSELIGRFATIWGGDIGAAVIRLSDGKYVVSQVVEGSPAQKAGIQVGAEVLRVNGKAVSDHLKGVPMYLSMGTPETVEQFALYRMFAFPLGQKVTVEYRNPSSLNAMSAVMAVEKTQPLAFATYPKDDTSAFSTDFLADGAIGYARWRDFGNVALNISSWETFLAETAGRPGMIIDMRGNLGGLESLYFTMASYLFKEENAVPIQWLETYNFDDKTRSFVKPNVLSDLKIFSPRAELAFSGKVVVLVDSRTASAGEFFAQYLQKSGRATVIGESGSAGAGGVMKQILLPGQMTFTYTGAQMYFVGTKTVNLEGKGVTPNIRVPITLENDKKKMMGEDLVLKFAIDYLKESFPKS